jgi:hypothetical protein
MRNMPRQAHDNGQQDPEVDLARLYLEKSKAALAAAREHGERARLLREERERLERIYFGRRFILIRF